MSTWDLVRAGLIHYRRTHRSVVAGFALASAVLVGALLVGDSVRGSLRARALDRIGAAQIALVTGDRPFLEALADRLGRALPGMRFAPALALDGSASWGGGARRANGVAVLGVDERFFQLAPQASDLAPGAGEAWLAERLAQQLDVAPGDELVLRVERPSALPRDMILATTDDTTAGMRVRVARVLGAADFGLFGLAAGPLAPANAYVSLHWLQEQVGLGRRANLLLGGGEGQSSELTREANLALRRSWSLMDAQLELRDREDGTVELRTPRVFLDDVLVQAIAGFGRPALGVLTYFVNALRHGERTTPYSTVAAVGRLTAPPAPGDQLLPRNLARDELVANAWLGRDLGLTPGDEVELTYFVPGPDRELVEASESFRVRAILPMTGLAADPDLMPDFPGLSDSEHCRDWEPGVPVDLSSIRDEDETYWEDYGGAPKALVSLAAGRELWANHFGTLTSIRLDGAGGDIADALEAAVDPAELGLFFRDLRGPALAGSDTATDFAVLFLGLSFFLIASALMLACLLLVFGVEQRSEEIGTLLALGFPPARVKGLLNAEVAVLVLLGGSLGALLGVLYTRAVLWGLATLWSGAVASTPIAYHGRVTSALVGTAIAVAVSMLAAQVALRRAVRSTPLELLGAGVGLAPAAQPGSRRKALALAAVAAAAALTIALTADPASGPVAASAFFGAGSALLVAGLALGRWVLARLGRGHTLPTSVAGLGLRNAARRPGRSLATLSLLAVGTFLVVAIGVHRRSALVDPTERGSGTGGFALVGSTSLPLHHDVNASEGRDALGLADRDLVGVAVVPLRVHEGDETSCLNLGVPQSPRLLGVDPEQLASRGAFTFASTIDTDLENPWRLLDGPDPDDPDADGAVPAVGDQASVTWTLHKKVGDTVEMLDGRGRHFRVRIVATVADSILQGSLVISERHFRRRFPAESGWRMLLVDAPPQGAGLVAASLTRAMATEGLELVPAQRRLARFQAVQNTYLDIFQALGALGVLLGSVGLGVVVLRNALERRRELAILTALGYARRALGRLLLGEHALLLVLGLGVGSLAAIVAVIPASQVAGAPASGRAALLLLALMAANGALWIASATALVLRGDRVAALRSE